MSAINLVTVVETNINPKALDVWIIEVAAGSQHHLYYMYANQKQNKTEFLACQKT